MKTKTCSTCKQCKSINEFDVTKSKPNGQSYCSECRRKWLREHYKKNKDYYKAKARSSAKRRREWMNSLKSKPCVDCGKAYPPYVMDFDHLSNKSFSIGNKYKTLSKDIILKEIQKCDLVCANCHRIRTHRRRS